MASKKSFNKPKLVDAVSMAGDSVSSSVDCLFMEVISFQFVWTGAPTGSIDIELSNDGISWTPANVDAVDPAGAASSSILEVETSSRYARSSYVATSGSGTLTVHVTGKSLS